MPKIDLPVLARGFVCAALAVTPFADAVAAPFEAEVDAVGAESRFNFNTALIDAESFGEPAFEGFGSAGDVADRVTDGSLSAADCNRLWDDYPLRDKESAAELAVLAGWCYLAQGNASRAFGYGEAAVYLSGTPARREEAHLIMARAMLLTCDYNLAQHFVDKVMRDASFRKGDKSEEALARERAAIRTQVSAGYIKRALLEVGVALVVGDDVLADSPDTKDARAQYNAELRRLSAGDVSRDRLRNLTAIVPNFCPTFTDAPEKKRFVPKVKKQSAADLAAQTLTCDVPKSESELAFEEEEVSNVFRDWIEAITPSCARFESNEVVLSTRGIAGLLAKYPKFASVATSKSKDGTGRYVVKIPRLHGFLKRDDSRTLAFEFVSERDIAKAFQEQLDGYGRLLIAEVPDRRVGVFTELASLECRYTYILASQYDEARARDYLEGAIQHYLTATDLAQKHGGGSPAFLLEAGVMAKINEDLGRSCEIFNNLVKQFPGSQEALDAEMYLATSCLRFSQAGAVAGKKEKASKQKHPVIDIDLNLAMSLLQKAERQATDIKKAMAIYSQAMIYKARGDFAATGKLLLGVVDYFISKGAGPVQNDWRTETIEEYLYVCTQDLSCDFDKLVKLQSQLSKESLAFEVARGTVEEVSKFEYANCEARLAETNRILQPALRLATSDADRALIRIMMAIEAMRCELSATTRREFASAVGVWRKAAEGREKNTEFQDRVIPLARAQILDLAREQISKAWYADRFQFMGAPQRGPKPYVPASGHLEFADMLADAFDAVGSPANALRTGLCYTRLYSYHANGFSAAEEKLKKAKKPFDARGVEVYWARAFEPFDAFSERYASREFEFAEWDFKGDILIETRNAQETWYERFGISDESAQKEELARLETFLRGAIESGKLPESDEPRYIANLVNVLLVQFGSANVGGAAETASAKSVKPDDKAAKDGKAGKDGKAANGSGVDETKLQEARNMLNRLRRRYPNAKEVVAANEMVMSAVAGLPQGDCHDIQSCTEQAARLKKMLKQGGNCAVRVRTQSAIADYYERAYHYTEAEAGWRNTCKLLEDECPAKKLSSEPDDWDNALYACKMGVSRNAVFQGSYDRSITAVSEVLPLCFKKESAEACLEMISRGYAAQGDYDSAIDTLQRALISPTNKFNDDFSYTSARYAARFCEASGNASCLPKAQWLADKAASTAAKKEGGKRKEVRTTLRETQWTLGLAYWKASQPKPAYNVWKACAGGDTPTPKKEYEDYFQVLCMSRNALIRSLAKSEIDLAGIVDFEHVARIEKQFLTLERETARQSGEIVNSLLVMKKGDPLIAIGDAWYRAYLALAKALERIAPEAEAIIESAYSRADTYREFGSTTYVKFLFGGDGEVELPPFDVNRKIVVLPSRQFDPRRFAKYGGDLEEGLPAPVGRAVLEALEQRRYDAVNYLVGDWCAQTGVHPVLPEIAASACNALGLTFALRGQFSPAILYFNEAEALSPRSPGALNNALLAKSFGAVAAANGHCERYKAAVGEDPRAALCMAESDDVAEVEAVINQCAAKSNQCVDGPWNQWSARLAEIPAQISSLYGSMREIDYLLSRE